MPLLPVLGLLEALWKAEEILHFLRLVGVGTLPVSLTFLTSSELGARGLERKEFSRELAKEGLLVSYSGRGEGKEIDDVVVAVEADRGPPVELVAVGR